MQIYIVLKAAREEFGEFVAATVEASFDSEQKARDYLKNKPAVWSEDIGGANCHCERSIVTSNLE